MNRNDEMRIRSLCKEAEAKIARAMKLLDDAYASHLEKETKSKEKELRAA